VGEFALLAALVPYYVMHLMVLMVGEEKFYVPAMTLCLWIVFGTIGLYRMLEKSPWFANDRQLILVLFVLGMTGSIVMFFCSYHNQASYGAHGEQPGEQRPGPELSTTQQQLLESQRNLERLARDGLDILKQRASETPCLDGQAGNPADQPVAAPPKP
jgi:hypothetical protein